MSEYEEPPLFVAIMAIMHYAVLYLFGKLRDLLRLFHIDMDHRPQESPKTSQFTNLYERFESFYVRNVYRRVFDCFNRPICSAPGAEFDLMVRTSRDHWWTSEFTGETKRVVNMGSYNYLGFGDTNGRCNDDVNDAINQYGVGVGSARHEVGQNALHRELEELVAEFVGTESAVTFGMGFATNALNIPAIIGRGCCVISDELNHASLILGIRLSGAETRVFKHNDMKSLESCLENAVVFGQRRTGRPFKKIIVVVEGIYSMEGSIVKLDEVVKLKNKYKAYLYVDEAHSMGALGKHGRGVVDYYGINPKEIDILMGTFSKSFSGVGGYIAGSRQLVDLVRTQSFANGYAESMAPPVAQQIISSMRIIMGRIDGDEGIKKIQNLAENSRYFRQRLIEMGFIIYGNDDSPVVPLMLYSPLIMGVFSRMALKEGLGIVIVGFPATPLLQCRARFCLSASHTREMLDRTLEAVDRIGDQIHVKHSRRRRAIKSKEMESKGSVKHADAMLDSEHMMPRKRLKNCIG